MKLKLIATVATCGLLVGTSLAVAQAPSSAGAGLPPPGAGGFGGANTRLQILPDNRVTFSISAPQATAVSVSVQDEPEISRSVTFTKNDAGVWTGTTTAPLPVRLYRYNYRVDGAVVADQANVDYSLSNSGLQAMFEIKGADTAFMSFKNVPHGDVHEVFYRSAPLGGILRQLHVYTPPGYEKGGAIKYPVLYLLHGAGGDDDGWRTRGGAIGILDTLLAEGRGRPMMVVRRAGNTGAGPGETAPPAPPPPPTVSTPGLPGNIPGMGGGPPGGAALNDVDLYSKDLRGAVMPLVKANYRVLEGPANTAIVGLSMGAGQTFNNAFYHPEDFGYVGLLSNSINNRIAIEADPAKLATAKKTFKLVYVGKDGSYPAFQSLPAYFENKGFKVAQQVVANGRHAWDVWQLNLADVAPKLFK